MQSENFCFKLLFRVGYFKQLFVGTSGHSEQFYGPSMPSALLPRSTLGTGELQCEEHPDVTTSEIRQASRPAVRAACSRPFELRPAAADLENADELPNEFQTMAFQAGRRPIPANLFGRTLQLSGAPGDAGKIPEHHASPRRRAGRSTVSVQPSLA